jgi:acyl dehydratase
MELDTALVGTPIPSTLIDITPRRTTNFAAAVADMNPRYFDDTRSANFQAPPLFAVAVTWPVIEKARELVSPEVMVRMVHAGEHLIFHGPIRPDTRLDVSGRVAAVQPTSAGALMTVKLEAWDHKGDLIFTEYTGAMFRGVECLGEGRCVEELPRLPGFDESADLLWETEIPIERRATYLYDGCTDIIFQIHTSQAFSRFAGLDDIILQGTAMLAMTAREIVDRQAGFDPNRLAEIACRFSSTITPGTSVKLQLIGEQLDLCGFRVLNAQGKPALTGSYRLKG